MGERDEEGEEERIVLRRSTVTLGIELGISVSFS